VVGCIITSLGPLFPYLAELEQRQETEYSFLFLSRAIGYILGSLLIKVAEKYMIFHRIIIISLLSLFTVVPFTFAQTLNQKGLFVFVMSVGNAWTDIGLNICIIETFKKTKNLDQWLQIAHGGFGIGGLIGPYVVYLFEEYSFLVLGAMGIVLIPFYFIFPSPEIRQR
jgi:MFS family permease